MFNKVWVLTFEVNDYDQHGEYFLAVFGEKPDSEKLANAMKESDPSFLEHVLSGGGRIGDEHQWFYLTEIDLL